jgi:hypothetical protein
MRVCLWCGDELTGRPDQQFCSPAHRLAAYRVQKAAESAAEARDAVSEPGDEAKVARRRETPLFPVPAGLDGESRRMVEYVNGEIDRWNARERDEPIDVILEAAKERVRRGRRARINPQKGGDCVCVILLT